MSGVNIANLQQLLSKHLGGSKKITETQITRLTGPGENFGSLMLKVDVTLKNENDSSEERLYGVAKMIPEAEFFRSIFNVQVTFKNEVAFYNVIVPTLGDFLTEQGVVDAIDIFPKFIAARNNLDETNGPVDENAVLMLENLKESGYTNVNRYVGFDLETAKLVLRGLSRFHSVPLALKQKRPDVFKQNILPYCDYVGPKPPPEEHEPDVVLLEVFKESETCLPYIDEIKESLKHKEHEKKNDEPESPFFTLAHTDMWINNVMVKFECEKPTRCKLVDFQLFAHASLARDLFFFLFTSVKHSVLMTHLDELIEYYYNSFVINLADIGADTTTLSFDIFLEEIKNVSKREFQHVIFMMLFVIMAKKGPTIENGDDKPPDFTELLKDLSPEAKERAWYVGRECGKRGWL